MVDNIDLQNFIEKFSPKVIEKLSGIDLLKLIAYPKYTDNNIKEQFKNLYEDNYDSLKNELENGMVDFGSGSAGYDINFVLAYRKGDWYNKKRRITFEEAIQIAEQIKQELVTACNFLNNNDFNSFYNYATNSQSGLFNKGYTHKYFHILYPRYIIFYHAGTWQQYYKQCLKLPQTQNYYDIEKYFLDNDSSCNVGEKSRELEKEFGVPTKRTWLLTWNPNKWHWESFEKDVDNVDKGINVESKYSCHSKKPRIGDRAFVLKLGENLPKGIIASGYVSHEPYMDIAEHTDDNKEMNCIKIKFDKIINFNQNEVLLQDILKKELPGQEWSPQSSGFEVKREIADKLEELWQSVNDNSKSSSEVNMSYENVNNIPLNQILYGPPGTGKTFSVRKYIDEILGKNPGLNIENEDQRINNVVKDSNWYSAIALSMYQNGKNNKYKVAELLEQKIIKAFSLTRENKNVRAALWAQMQIHTHENCPNVNYSNRLAPFIFEKNENSEWYLTEDGIKFVEENLSEQLEQLSAKNNTRKLEDFYKFLTFHQSYSYEEFVEGIKPQIRTDEECSSVSYEYNKGVFKEICQQANSDPDNNYLLIIDEINRGNISKIFGELITLIEINKRVMPNGERIFENTVTKDEQLLVTLPYTKSKFGVPNNLYILGTMNTSDRSIASIDIALRRRFKFKEMMPNSSLVADFGIGFNKIFDDLNNKIKLLLDRDHQIGHSYFIETKYADADINILKEIWFSEILPLLNEYFYCDWEKLKLIIPGFIKKLDVPEMLKNECDDSIYEFKTFDEVSDFEKALNQKKFEQV